jgi:hypothetical protein
MRKKTQIWNHIHTVKIDVPPACMRLCDKCQEPMPISYYYWPDDREVVIAYLCQHRGYGRYKVVQATLDKKGRLS